jgi:hypothetical protein
VPQRSERSFANPYSTPEYTTGALLISSYIQCGSRSAPMGHVTPQARSAPAQERRKGPGSHSVRFRCIDPNLSPRSADAFGLNPQSRRTESDLTVAESLCRLRETRQGETRWRPVLTFLLAPRWRHNPGDPGHRRSGCIGLFRSRPRSAWASPRPATSGPAVRFR